MRGLINRNQYLNRSITIPYVVFYNLKEVSVKVKAYKIEMDPPSPSPNTLKLFNLSFNVRNLIYSLQQTRPQLLKRRESL